MKMNKVRVKLCSLFLAAALAASAVPSNVFADETAETAVIEAEEEAAENTDTQEPETQEPETQEPETQEPETEEPEITTGFYQDENGDWYYYVEGELASDFTGYAENEDSWWYVTEGKFDNTFTGMAKKSDGWWYAKDGVLDTSYTGLAKCQYGWFYVKDGKYDTSYTGLAKCQYGWFYVKNGKLDSTYTGLAKCQYGWFYVKNGKYDTSYTGLAKCQYGWFYAKNGKLDRTYTGMAKCQYGWFYVTKGKLNNSYTGIGTNDNGTWYFKDGRIYQNHAGEVTVNGTSYCITSTGRIVNGWKQTGSVWKYYRNGYVKYSSNAMHTAFTKIDGKESGTEYYLVVDRSNFTVFVFRMENGTWEPYKVMTCAVGKKGTETPAGTFTIFTRWDILESSASWEYYPIEFYTCYEGTYCFHSVLYYKGTPVSNAENAKLKDGTVGAAISHGCVRLSLANSKWLYYNCANGTKVLIY